MSNIKPINPETVSLIAAGEVIEDPASVIKELVENAIDSKPSKIRIEIEDYSDNFYIKVTDDGDGMPPEDLFLCTKAHYSSKLHDTSDLMNIKTLGFRGEGLSSICTVADVLIKSKTKESVTGYVIETVNNLPTEPVPLGMPAGTTVEVKNLFHSLPARKKFLGSPNKEFGKVLDVLTGLVLSSPAIGFSFYRNSKSVFSFSPNSNILDVLWWFFGTSYVSNIFNANHLSEHVRISGYLFRPQINSTTKSKQFTFINKRYVQSDLVSRAVKDAYGNLLDVKSYPSFVLYLELNPSLVDFNVHPKKTLVKFWDDDYIYKQVLDGVKSSLEKQNLTYVEDYKTDIFGIPKNALIYTFSTLKEKTDTWSPKDSLMEEDTIQIANTYIGVPVDAGLLLIDQHAAHESILYEQFLSEFKRQTSEEINGSFNFRLKDSVILSLSISDYDLLQNYLSFFSKLGFEIEEFGDLTIRINAVPAFYQSHDLSTLLNELLEDLRTFGFVKNVDENSNRTLAYLACRGAIKAGEKLTGPERLNLIKKLTEENFLYTCPHGRPVKVLVTNRELGRLFKRI